VRNDKIPAFMRLHPMATIPARQYPDDIGWDLTTRLDQDLVIEPTQFCDIPCDLAVQLPRGSWAMLVGRSSALRRHGLLINPGIIDEGYIGPLFAGAFNVTRHPIVVSDGMRLAQLIVIPRMDPITHRPQEVRELRPTGRGAAGFGSTGR
jgi:dUTP pyrophosphatase